MARGVRISFCRQAAQTLLGRGFAEVPTCFSLMRWRVSRGRRHGTVILADPEKGIGPMTKNELISAVADTSRITKTDAAKAVEATFDIITGALKGGDEVKLIGFGTFTVVDRKAREGRNPRTGQPVMIAASKAPKFSAGKGLKDAVNI
jgi:DNA-binding protein HU-beta